MTTRPPSRRSTIARRVLAFVGVVIMVALWRSVGDAPARFIGLLTGPEAPPPEDDPTDPFVAHFAARSFRTDAERIIAVRELVFENSIHQIDEEHDTYATRSDEVMGRLGRTLVSGAPPPHLSCGPRANAMKRILRALGIDARVVLFVTDDYAELRSHTFLDVRERDTGLWGAHDPDYNVSYVGAHTGEPVSALALLTGSLEDVTPRSTLADGWFETGTELLRNAYFEALVYLDQVDAGRSKVVINTDRFELHKRFPENRSMDLFAFAFFNYADPVFLLTHNGPLSLRGYDGISERASSAGACEAVDGFCDTPVRGAGCDDAQRACMMPRAP